MDSSRRTALVTGALFIVTFVTSIPAALLLYTPVLDDPNYVVGAGADTGVAVGALLGVIEPDSALKNLAAAPEFVWELSLGI